MKLNNEQKSLTVVEIPPQDNAAAYRERMEEDGFSVEVDKPIFPNPIKEESKG